MTANPLTQPPTTMNITQAEITFMETTWEGRKQQARPFLRSASELARALGPLQQASDCSPAGLACALVNGELRDGGWCKCDRHSSANDCYYVYPDGQHGWMCSECCGVTQVG